MEEERKVVKNGKTSKVFLLMTCVVSLLSYHEEFVRQHCQFCGVEISKVQRSLWPFMIDKHYKTYMVQGTLPIIVMLCQVKMIRMQLRTLKDTVSCTSTQGDKDQKKFDVLH